jgi:hypothetical protein
MGTPSRAENRILLVTSLQMGQKNLINYSCVCVSDCKTRFH